MCIWWIKESMSSSTRIQWQTEIEMHSVLRTHAHIKVACTCAKPKKDDIKWSLFSVHVAISLLALNIWKTITSARSRLCVSTRALVSVYVAYTQFNISDALLTFSPFLSVLKPQPHTRFERHNVAHLFNANTIY